VSGSIQFLPFVVDRILLEGVPHFTGNAIRALRLTMRTALPDLDAHYHRIIEAGAVRVIDRFVTSDEMAQLHAQSDIYLLPAARIHIVSLLQAMGHGLPVIVSDGWGFAEYVEDGRNGLILPGRYGMSSWADIEGGAMREDSGAVYAPDPADRPRDCRCRDSTRSRIPT
jgi:glycosyltransferase involved in cell wall biosynthesis